jgi:hypothetical protein
MLFIDFIHILGYLGGVSILRIRMLKAIIRHVARIKPFVGCGTRSHGCGQWNSELRF